MKSVIQTPPTMKAYFIAYGQKLTYAKGQTFMRADDPRPWVYFLEEGLVSATFRFENETECILGYFIPNSVFAQNKSFYEDDGGSLDYTTTTKSIAYRLHRDEFMEQVYSDWKFNREYMDNTLIFRVFTTDRAICLAEQRIHNRCIRWLMLVAKYYSEPYRGGLRIVIPLTQGTIAKFLNISRESVSKIVHRLAQDGHISIHRRQIIIHDPKNLSELLEA